MENLTGKQIGRYKILKAIGEGGMASVYLAEDTNLERQVAVKVIRAERVTPEQLPRIMERFKREAKALARLSDEPGIVTVYDYGEYEGTPYLVMAYMPGGTLKERLGQPMAYREAARLLLPVAEALSEAHRHGIIHRDVKPSNLLVTRKGTLALADFGIAKALETEGQTLTSTGMGVGTPEYMAPEQWRGEAIPQTDVYALGVVLYEMLTGKKPYTAGTPSEVFLKQMTQPPERPRKLVPGLPEMVEALLDKAMDKEPDARFANVADFQSALAGVLAGSPVYDDIPILVMQPKAKPETSDPEATHDELATPSPLGEVPLPVVEEVEENTEKLPRSQVKDDKPEKGFSQPVAKRKPKWSWPILGLVLVGVMIGVGNGLVKLGLQGIGPLAGLATPTMMVTPTLTLGVGSTMISEVDGMEMAYVPAGMFTMGSIDGGSDEEPAHEVYLDGYWLDKFEVTNGQFAAFLNDIGNQREGGATWLDAGDGDECIHQKNGEWQAEARYEDHPVIEVSWYGAAAYCEWAGRRLPSEAEWEKAARGTDERTYPWGNESLSASLLNYNSNENGTTVIGSYGVGASPYGALDMAGNVWEWTADWYDGNYYSVSPDENPTGPSVGGYRVLRGGSWFSYFWDVRSASRNGLSPSGTYDNGGFRCTASP